MCRDGLSEKLGSWARDRGHKVAWGSVSLLADAKSRLERLHEEGALSESLHRDLFGWFTYEKAEGIEEPRSVIIIAIPRPAHRLVFALENGSLITVLPPTYVEYRRLLDDTIRDLADSGVFDSYRFEAFKAPLKSVAAMLGLVAYGRNNISYIDGLGSYFQLVGLITDAQLPDPPDGYLPEPEFRQECGDCTLCAKACPTGAIRRKGNLIDHDRCFTLHNEAAEPWPKWIEPVLGKCFSTHNCLIGCLACQEVCPINRGKLETVSAGISFTPEETSALLFSQPGDAENSIREKLDKINISAYLEQIRSNLIEIYKAGQ